MKNGASVEAGEKPAIAVEVPKKYREPLPDDCPAKVLKPLRSPAIVYRLLPAAIPEQGHFDSFAKLGKRKKPPFCSECEWASCSVFLPKGPKHDQAAYSHLPKMKDRTHVAHVKIDKHSGTVKLSGESKHVSLWMFADFDPVEACVEIVALEEVSK